MRTNLVAAAGLMLAVGCGPSPGALDSDDGGGDSTDDTGGSDTATDGDPDAPRECLVIGEIEVGTERIRHEIEQTGNSLGSCGGPGSEVSWVLRPEEDVDVAVLMDEYDHRDNVVRVEVGGCGLDQGALMCLGTAEPGAFLARAGEEYFITVDSTVRVPGPFGLKFRWGLSAECEDGGPPAWAEPGASLVWNATLGPGPGLIPSYCDAPGTEVVFPVHVSAPTHMTATARTDPGMNPVLNLRGTCDTPTELGCVTGTGDSAVLELDLEPGEYWLVLDQASTKGGTYGIEVVFE